jgi:Protein of unknown function (DUF2975)
MNAPAPRNTYPQRIRRMSRILANACLVLIVTLPIAVAMAWYLTDTVQLAVRANLPADAIRSPLLAWQRFAGALATETALAFLLVGLWEARACFRLFAAGDVFTSQAARRLRNFAGWMLGFVVAGIVATAAITAVLTMNNPPGMRHLAVSVGSDQVFMLLFAGMVWLMAAVIGQGTSMAEENATFV